ncbi:hypothetical protein AVEN_28777-1 [Araneus ventricosus]|uniref:Uncharacterized protein n=1 Tax=Araneus ventricosus TaxID=182803 RepID=A0A4Y2TMF6_ARAVE|nr:hypothetical protein AVEN_237254-1 [Araneus ventricosus]GBO02292.1 hypothetical protein AVEN_28777-1 [Araneus ventricosus]
MTNSSSKGAERIAKVMLSSSSLLSNSSDLNQIRSIPDSKESCGKVAISLSIGCPRKHFRPNRFGNHCRKVYVGKFFMNYLTDKVCTTSPRRHFRANRS